MVQVGEAAFNSVRSREGSHHGNGLVDGSGRLAVLAEVILLSESDHACEHEHDGGHPQLLLDVLVRAVSAHKGIASVVLEVNYLNECESNTVHNDEENENAEGDVGGVDVVAVVQGLEVLGSGVSARPNLHGEQVCNGAGKQVESNGSQNEVQDCVPVYWRIRVVSQVYLCSNLSHSLGIEDSVVDLLGDLRLFLFGFS